MLMIQGTVRFYSHERGFGFITPDAGGRDLFVHQSDIVSNGFRKLAERQRVAFEIETGERGPRAVVVRPV